ncbi:protein of unknown function DUF1080 [Cellulophaga algicola DSM 14237]|uniref:3-keto-alpha-glucoside-1,2-lyase/3-keto-2-hydroxy-glucal hydratase domain-containing protein n=1 Tax=Cellulophaga algicola (strain DSM 14237 / IC166 / ACAM 630) TaxID=688270 RepID=E6XCR1_CELAD|nr:DUF1080 domain-containing protein [Cellulophaga algicola]ADV49050.1 protein of unknown function DUF1080 [Cellulophaga algicola DSM 14237]
MKYFYMVTLLTFFSCNAQTKEVKTTEEPTVITYDEYSGEEPTTPEQTEFYAPVPPVVKPAQNNGVPSDAIVLFNNNSLNEWVSVNNENKPADWIINTDGSFTVKNKAGDIRTVQEFGDIQLHLEWKSPAVVKGDNQSRANSGIFLQGRYEVQILDNNDNDTYVNGQVASIYKQHIPLAKASVPSGEWNTYDIIYHAPEFNKKGQKTTAATITVLHNGILVQDHVAIKGTTPYIGWPKNEAHGKAPIILQDHGDDSGVSFRNIWVRALK